ncbi:MAG: SMP-30/gluconolactonase/LRE family protein, partial [Cyclobacteriaceae bacterium]
QGSFVNYPFFLLSSNLTLLKRKMEIRLDQIRVLADGLDHVEGVAVHPDGHIWAGGEAGQIYKISADGTQVEEVANTGGFVLGIAFNPTAEWLAVCDNRQHCVWKYELASGELSRFADGAGDHQFNIPNYPVFDSQGSLYVSESGEFRQKIGKILKFGADGKHVVWHSGPFNFANGLALSPDEKMLYVACTWLPGVERIPILSDGSAGERSVFATLPQTCPDGLAFDAEANLYVSCYAPNRIYRVTPEQEVSLLIDDWEGHTLSNPTNIAFGGREFDQLYTSNLGRYHVNQIDLGVRGAPLACHKKAW